ncbi:hypothetical protein [Porphyromonas sp.]|uniref:hypothetical protein n=1 Tax=Porphyromonas sp. TaxID=1924944 RepID=UPI0026DB6B8C|nr:hypothetical protein [Porphyromonas sp.]MDO4771335.1 hypothetical protein [Porphyromonas sp.]
MKRSFVSIILIVMSFFTAKAQEYKPEWQHVDTMTVVRTEGERHLKFVEKTDVVPKAFFVEAGGAGVSFLSFNFESRFAHQLNGLGARVGASFLSFSEERVFTLPVQLNYLLGSRGKYFEMGIGATLFYGYSDPSSSLGGITDQKNYFNILGTTTFGYRYQPVKGGFMFRVGFSPLFLHEEGEFIFVPYMPYLSFGYSF